MPPIHHTFAPHVDTRYALRTLGLLLRPWLWQRGKSIEALRQELERRFGMRAFLFASGREALQALLRSLQVRPGEEVIIQGYTCVVVPNAIHAAGAAPAYADVDPETLNLDPEEVERALTRRTRAVICQHTFGIPAETKRLRELCNEHRILFIEDCAHVLPDETGPHEIARDGDALLLSFGRDKAISGIAGGAVLVRDPEIAEILRKEEERAIHLSRITILRLLSYPLAYAVARPFYGIGIGKAFLWLLSKLRIMPSVLEPEEKEGHATPLFHRIPNACAALALWQFQKLQRINNHRRSLTRFYLEHARTHGWKFPQAINSDLPLQKFPIFTKNAEVIRRSLKRKNIHLDDGWTGCVVCPSSVKLTETGYIPGSDPEAEAASEMILSLPTHPTMTLHQAQRLEQALHALLSES